MPLKAQDYFSNLKQKFENGKIYKAEFHHQTFDSYTKDSTTTSGNIWVGKTRYKITGVNQSVVVNGETSKVYDDNRNRVIISKYEPSNDDFAPSRVLRGVDSTLTVETQEKRGNAYYIRLGADDPFAIYNKVELFLSSSFIPQKIRAVDPVDNVITTSFSSGKFIQVPENFFRLDYPGDAEVIDMRKQ